MGWSFELTHMQVVLRPKTSVAVKGLTPRGYDGSANECGNVWAYRRFRGPGARGGDQIPLFSNIFDFMQHPITCA